MGITYVLRDVEDSVTEPRIEEYDDESEEVRDGLENEPEADTYTAYDGDGDQDEDNESDEDLVNILDKDAEDL
ncbi:hypothetical protein L1987_72223 [Smallanthus sonchifolius]|uniref:Uncharacterized protein n=1 Tax=Smallanthus sonchifolius TaxID=185202 RepID=A0ACB9AVI4_9ASTR|nr:hypothetical protein L1987_72223 [Smallanthus sonchifolius]